ncbi:MAG: RNA-binding protein [Gammaproteobacteria bacterium]|nr:RNA-binding protein [Gammaproteobacteria bacterium]
MNNKIYIGNLPFKMEPNELRDAFARFGEITDLFLVKDRDTGRLKGFGFITFANESAAHAALQMDGEKFGGRDLKVSIAKDREDREGGAAGGRGGRGDRDSGGRGDWRGA